MRAYQVTELHMTLDAGAPLPVQLQALALAKSLPGYTVDQVRKMDQDDALDQMEWLNVAAAAAARDRLGDRHNPSADDALVMALNAAIAAGEDVLPMTTGV